MGTALVSGVSAVTEHSGLGRIVPAREATAASARVDVPPAPLAQPARKERRGVRLPSFTVFDLEPSPDTSAGQNPVTTSSADAVDAVSDAIRQSHAVVSGDPTSTVAGRTAAPPIGENMPEDIIYSSGSSGVAPPVGVRLQLRRQLPNGVDPDTLGRIDLVIAEDGSVQSVQLLGHRLTIRESMMLSAAKAWEFKPAVKDGHPVKYRKTVWMAFE